MEEKKCIRCKRIIVGKSKLGLCQDCINKYGTPAAGIGVGLLLVGGRIVVKNSGKIAKAALKMIGKG